MKLRKSIHWRIPLLAVTALVLEAGAVVMSSPAGATTTTFTNPTSCSASVQNGVCISSVSANYGASTVTLTMTVGKATDPTTDPNWLNETQTKVSWNIATASSTTPTYVAEADSSSNTPGTYSGVVSSIGSVASGGSLTKTCDHSTGVTVSSSLPNNQYSLSFPPSCIGSPASFTVQALMSYVPGSGSTPETAAAPGTPQSFSSCCSVTSDPTSTSTTTTTTSSTTTTTSSTTTTTPTTAPVTSPAPAALASTGNSGSGPSSASAPSLAGTGAGPAYPLLIALAVVLLGLGGLGRRVLRRRRAPSGGSSAS